MANISGNNFRTIGMLQIALLIKSLTVLLFTHGVSGLRLTAINMPSKAAVGESVWLNCSYDLESDQLYSIKWYKDQEEIYRFLPSGEPPKRRYEAIGLNLDISKSNYGNVFVDLIDHRSSGDYRCEVSADAPSFETVRETHAMHVFNVSKVRLTKINMPSKAVVGEGIWLNCSYDLENNQLYSIKWYKDQKEIYRFLPSRDPPKKRYEVSGLNLNLSKSNYGNVFVELVDHRSTGDYRCEVSAGAPSFETVRETHAMRVYMTANGINRSQRPVTAYCLVLLLLIAVLIN